MTDATPAPWEVGGPVHFDAHGVEILAADNAVVAIALDEDNARMIASSPELLASLKAMTELCAVIPLDAEPIYDAAIAAIAKAES